jgi:hypothetical protein
MHENTGSLRCSRTDGQASRFGQLQQRVADLLRSPASIGPLPTAVPECAESEHHARDRFGSESTLQRARMTTQPAAADAGFERRLVAKGAVRSAEKSPESDRYRNERSRRAHAGASPL